MELLAHNGGYYLLAVVEGDLQSVLGHDYKDSVGRPIDRHIDDPAQGEARSRMVPQRSGGGEVGDDTPNHSDPGATDAHDYDGRRNGRMNRRGERECHENRIKMRSV